MKNFKNASIKRKQTLIIMLTTSAALLLACAAFVTYEVITFRKAMVRNLFTLAEIVGDNSAAALDYDDPKSAEEMLSHLKDEPNIIAACIYLKNGEVLAKYSRAGDEGKFIPPKIQMSGHSFDRRRLALFDPIDYKGEVIGVFYVESDMQALYSRLERYGAIVVGVFTFSLLAAFALTARLQRFISEPILHLVQTTRTVARERDYSVRAVKHSEDELGSLIDGFNEMLAQIQGRDSALQAARDQLESRVQERTQELANSLSLVHATLESTTDGILVVNSQDEITNWNQQFIQMWEVPEAIIVSRNRAQLRELARNKLVDFEGFLRQIEEMVAHPDAESFDVLEFKDGRIFERYSKPQQVGANSVGRVWSFRDVTSRKLAEAELAHERDLLRTLLDHSPDQIYFKDTDSRFRRCSKSQSELLGVGIEQIIGKSDADFFAEDHSRPAFEDEQEIMRTGKPMIGKIEREVWKDGKRITWSLTSKMPFRNKDGKIIGTFGISKDITAIKEAEAKLEQAHRQLVETSRMAGMAEVATSVLHNVGNVLNSVNISTSLISEKVKKSKISNLGKIATLFNEHAADLPGFFANNPKGRQVPGYLAALAVHLADEQEEMLQELGSLVNNVEHIKEIVAMQQSYAKVSGVLESLPVAELVEDALRLNAGAMERHRVRVIRDFAETSPVLVDKHKVLQILVNLIRNAKYAIDDAMPPEKRMTLEIRPKGPDWVRISVIDNGIGIPDENLTRIFAHGFTTRKDGHGFGLHSGALAAKEMGGSLTVQSAGHGQGATFTLEIPCQPKNEIL